THPPPSSPGLTRRSISLRKEFFAKNDGPAGQARGRRSSQCWVNFSGNRFRSGQLTIRLSVFAVAPNRLWPELSANRVPGIVPGCIQINVPGRDRAKDV